MEAFHEGLALAGGTQRPCCIQAGATAVFIYAWICMLCCNAAMHENYAIGG